MTAYYNRNTEKKRRQQLRNSMPSPEVLLWSRLKGRQLLGCKFRRQSSVGSYVLDFYSPEVKLAVELDGDSHYQPGARQYDERRTQFIESFGIKILRYVNSEIYDNLDGVLEAIGREVLARSGARGLSEPAPLTSSEAREGSETPPLAPPYQGGESARAFAGGGALSEAQPASAPLDKGGPGGVATPHQPQMPADPATRTPAAVPPLDKGGSGGVSPPPRQVRQEPRTPTSKHHVPPLDKGGAGGVSPHTRHASASATGAPEPGAPQ